MADFCVNVFSLVWAVVSPILALGIKQYFSWNSGVENSSDCALIIYIANDRRPGDALNPSTPLIIGDVWSSLPDTVPQEAEKIAAFNKKCDIGPINKIYQTLDETLRVSNIGEFQGILIESSKIDFLSSEGMDRMRSILEILDDVAELTERRRLHVFYQGPITALPAIAYRLFSSAKGKLYYFAKDRYLPINKEIHIKNSSTPESGDEAQNGGAQ